PTDLGCPHGRPLSPGRLRSWRPTRPARAEGPASGSRPRSCRYLTRALAPGSAAAVASGRGGEGGLLLGPAEYREPTAGTAGLHDYARSSDRAGGRVAGKPRGAPG